MEAKQASGHDSTEKTSYEILLWDFEIRPVHISADDWLPIRIHPEHLKWQTTKLQHLFIVITMLCINVNTKILIVIVIVLGVNMVLHCFEMTVLSIYQYKGITYQLCNN